MKKFFPVLFAGILALFLVACGGNSGGNAGGGSGSGDAGSAESGIVITPFQNIGGFTATVNGTYTGETTAEITLKEGESLVIVGSCTEGETTISSAHKGEWIMDDYFYDGFGASETELDPGTYELTIKPEGVTGTFHVVAYPAGTIDYMNMEAEEIFNTVQDYVNSNA